MCISFAERHRCQRSEVGGQISDVRCRMSEARGQMSDVGSRGKGHIRNQIYLKLLYIFLHKGQLNSFSQHIRGFADCGDGHVVCLFIEKTFQR